VVARIVIELTNRCNLQCLHCFEERHAATGDLPMEIIEKIISEGKSCQINQLSFTGGEPTIHRHFDEIVRRVAEAHYEFGIVSNGSTFIHVYPVLVAHLEWFKGITFSLDGALEQTHDRLRGEGSYRRVLQAASICTFRNLPFSFNMVLTAGNRHELRDMVSLAGQLGARGVRFGHLMSTPDTHQRGLDLSHRERREVEGEIWQLQKEALIPVAMAPGYFSEDPFFSCAPLAVQEYSLDYRGNLTLCCQLSGYPRGASRTDVMGNLHEVSLKETCAHFRRRVASYLADKKERVQTGQFTELDHFPCWYCVNYLKKGDVAAHQSIAP